jgi:N-dimethylarginine dimethylaminohydrolase
VRPTFLRAHAAGAPTEASPADGADDAACRLLGEAGLDVRVARAPWQGQVDLITLERNRFLICHGGASPSSRQAADELRAMLPMAAQVLEVELAPGVARGVQAVQYIAGAGGAVLLCHRAALRSHTPEQLGRFAGSHVEVLGLGEEDIAARASECLVVRGHALMAPGSSTILRGQLARRGFQIVEVELVHLTGPAGGGPRELALDLPGLVLAEDSPSYANRRGELVQRLDRYPAA